MILQDLEAERAGMMNLLRLQFYSRVRWPATSPRSTLNQPQGFVLRPRGRLRVRLDELVLILRFVRLCRKLSIRQFLTTSNILLPRGRPWLRGSLQWVTHRAAGYHTDSDRDIADNPCHRRSLCYSISIFDSLLSSTPAHRHAAPIDDLELADGAAALWYAVSLRLNDVSICP